MGKKVTLEDFSRNFNVEFPADYGEIYVINEEAFEYYYHEKRKHGGPWVTLRKDETGHWFYIRLNNVSTSSVHDTLQECINAAYHDMLRSKY